MNKDSIFTILFFIIIAISCSSYEDDYISTADYMSDWVKTISNKEKEITKKIDDYHREMRNAIKKQEKIQKSFSEEKKRYIEKLLNGVKSFYAKKLIRELEFCSTKGKNQRMLEIREELKIYYSRDYETYIHNKDTISYNKK